jgi:hypothetical protein
LGLFALIWLIVYLQGKGQPLVFESSHDPRSYTRFKYTRNQSLGFGCSRLFLYQLHLAVCRRDQMTTLTPSPAGLKEFRRPAAILILAVGALAADRVRGGVRIAETIGSVALAAGAKQRLMCERTVYGLLAPERRIRLRGSRQSCHHSNPQGLKTIPEYG